MTQRRAACTIKTLGASSKGLLLAREGDLSHLLQLTAPKNRLKINSPAGAMFIVTYRVLQFVLWKGLNSVSSCTEIIGNLILLPDVLA